MLKTAHTTPGRARLPSPNEFLSSSSSMFEMQKWAARGDFPQRGELVCLSNKRDATALVLRLSSVASVNVCACSSPSCTKGAGHTVYRSRRLRSGFPRAHHERASLRCASTTRTTLPSSLHRRFGLNKHLISALTNFSSAEQCAECLGLPRSRRRLSKLETCRCRSLL